MMSSFVYKKIIKNTFWIYLFSYIGAPLGYFIRMLISRDTSVEELGFLYSLIGFIVLISTYNGLGLTESLKYFIPKYLAENKLIYIRKSLVWSIVAQIIMGMMIVAGLYMSSEYLATKYFKVPDLGYFLKLSCFYFIGTNIMQTLTAVFLGFQDAFSSKLMEIIQLLVTLVFTVGVFFMQNGDVLMYSGGRLLGLIVGLIVGFFMYFTKYHKIIFTAKGEVESGFLKTFLRYSFWTFLGMNSGVLLGAIDQQMIISMLGPKEAGLYSNYLSLIGFFSVGISPLVAILIPTFTDLLAQGIKERFVFLKTKIYSYTAIFSLSLSTILFVIAPQLVSILYGNEYLISGSLLRISVLFYSFNVLAMLNFSLLSAYGKIQSKTILMLVISLLNIILNYFLIQYFSLYGALYATVVGWILLAGSSFYLLRKEKLILEWRVIGRNVIFTILLGTIIRLILQKVEYLSEDHMYFRLLALLVSVSLYYIVLIMINRSDVRGVLFLLFKKT